MRAVNVVSPDGKIASWFGFDLLAEEVILTIRCSRDDFETIIPSGNVEEADLQHVLVWREVDQRSKMIDWKEIKTTRAVSGKLHDGSWRQEKTDDHQKKGQYEGVLDIVIDKSDLTQKGIEVGHVLL